METNSGRWIYTVENPSTGIFESFDGEGEAVERAKLRGKTERASVAVFKAWERPSGIVSHSVPGAGRIFCTEWKEVK